MLLILLQSQHGAFAQSVTSAGCRNENVWEVEALGQLGNGCAGHYQSIIKYITEVLPLAGSLASWGF